MKTLYYSISNKIELFSKTTLLTTNQNSLNIRISEFREKFLNESCISAFISSIKKLNLFDAAVYTLTVHFRHCNDIVKQALIISCALSVSALDIQFFVLLLFFQLEPNFNMPLPLQFSNEYVT